MAAARETDARVAARGLDQRVARLDAALLLRLLEHAPPDAVLDRAAGVQEFALGEELASRLAPHAAQADHRRVADRFEDGVLDLCHVDSAGGRAPQRKTAAGRDGRATRSSGRAGGRKSAHSNLSVPCQEQLRQVGSGEDRLSPLRRCRSCSWHRIDTLRSAVDLPARAGRSCRSPRVRPRTAPAGDRVRRCGRRGPRALRSRARTPTGATGR